MKTLTNVKEKCSIFIRNFFFIFEQIMNIDDDQEIEILKNEKYIFIRLIFFVYKLNFAHNNFFNIRNYVNLSKLFSNHFF